MLGKHSQQGGLFEADNQYLDFVGRESFYGFLASQRGRLFRDEDFAAFYCPDNGRPSVAPSRLANALLLQTYEGVSDEEAKARADYDLRWKVALGIEVDERPFAKSTLQLFRAQLILKEKMREMFVRSLELAKQSGYLQERRLKVILDTTYILGRGAVKDTYNLLGDGIQQLCRALAAAQNKKLAAWVKAHQFQGYFGKSLKGEAAIDWDDEPARNALLGKIVADAQRLMWLAQERQTSLPEGHPAAKRIAMAGELLGQLIEQDVEQTDEPPELKKGVSRDRVVSAHDPEMRHGRKSRSKRFDGHKAAIAVDGDSQLITEVKVLPGNAWDATDALALTEGSEANTGLEVEETVGDCAYGAGDTRQEFADAGRKLVAKVADHGRKGYFHKSQFDINLETMKCTCPAGQTTDTLITSGTRLDKQGQKHPQKSFAFPLEMCAACSLRKQCYRSKTKRGRLVLLHPQEELFQQARAFQNSPEFQPYRSARQTAEHRLARLVQLGIRQAHYFGRKKTTFQLLLAATVANLTLIATRTGQMNPNGKPLSSFLHWLRSKKTYLGKHFASFGSILDVHHSEMPVSG
jgi:transposase